MKKIIVSLFLIFSVNPSLCTEQPHKTHEELIQYFTNVMISMYQNLVHNHIITIEHLKKLEHADRLISPLSQDERNGLSSDQLVRIKELEARLNVPVIMPQINAWARKTIMALTGEQETKERIHEDTKEIYRSMRFFEVPASTYVDQITDETFEILPGIEVQDTPVTQWQWTQIMGSNPAHCVDGPGSTEINKIKIVPNAPVENVSWNDVQEFIKKLNEKNDGYVYALPSVDEYQAILQHAYGKDWIKESIASKRCANIESSCALPIFNHKKEIFDVVCNVWQWTRDCVEAKDKQAHLVFGTSYATDTKKIALLKDVMRPIFCCGSKDQILGLRLVRYKKSEQCEQSIKKYNVHQLSWDQTDSDLDSHWYWNDVDQMFMFKNEGLRWMFEHENDYTKELRDTLYLLSLSYSGKDPADYLMNKSELYFCCNVRQLDISPLSHLRNIIDLDLSHNNIQDLAPLANLTNLGRLYLIENQLKDIRPLANLRSLGALYLPNNQIQDVNPLANLTNLTRLNLDNNQIQDVSPLANLTNLIDLSLKNNPIQDLGSLQKLKNLKKLYLDKDQVERLHAREMFPNVEISTY